MKKLNDKEMKQIKGGSLTGTVISAFKNVLNIIFEFGRSLGSSFRRIKEKNYCNL